MSLRSASSGSGKNISAKIVAFSRGSYSILALPSLRNGGVKAALGLSRFLVYLTSFYTFPILSATSVTLLRWSSVKFRFTRDLAYLLTSL